MDKLKRAISFLKSFRRKDWDFEDFPVRVVERAPHELRPIHGHTPLRWAAWIIDWVPMRSDGDTPEEAVATLRQRFESFKAENSRLPRPGTRVMPKIVFTPDNEIEDHYDIVEDLMLRVLGFEPGNYLLTNDSSLWDFNDEEEASNEVYYRKIMLLYGIDVSDIEPPTIASIARRIHGSRSAG